MRVSSLNSSNSKFTALETFINAFWGLFSYLWLLQRNCIPTCLKVPCSIHRFNWWWPICLLSFIPSSSLDLHFHLGYKSKISCPHRLSLLTLLLNPSRIVQFSYCTCEFIIPYLVLFFHNFYLLEDSQFALSSFCPLLFHLSSASHKN